MPRRTRADLGDGVFHITVRGNDRMDIFGDDRDRIVYLRMLEAVVARFAWSCHAFCLMPNHVHLVVGCTGAALTAGMRRLSGGYARFFNDRYGRTGHLWQGRYDARAIERDHHFEAVCRYVVENPVRAGLCDDVDDWRWSGLARDVFLVTSGTVPFGDSP